MFSYNTFYSVHCREQGKHDDSDGVQFSKEAKKEAVDTLMRSKQQFMKDARAELEKEKITDAEMESWFIRKLLQSPYESNQSKPNGRKLI